MSASSSENAAKAVANKEGEFGSHVASTAPETTKGHKPGVQASPKDSAPESTVKVLPPGSAPASKTHAPNPDPTENPTSTPDAPAAASDTLTGATSGDVHTGLGHPGSGMSSKELHDADRPARGGLQGVGAEGAASHTQFGSSKVDMTTSVPGATRKTTGEAVPADEDRSM